MSDATIASPSRQLMASVAAVVVAFGSALLLIVLAGYPAGTVVDAYWQGSFGSTTAIAGTLQRMIPLVLVAYGWILVSSTNRLSIGYEGQILAGGVVATFIAVNAGGLPAYVHLPLAVLGGIVGGALWASIAAALYVSRGVTVILSTFMLNFIAVQLVSYLVRGPMQEPSGMLLQTETIADTAAWGHFGTTALAWDILYVPIAAALLVLLLRRTTIGMRLRILSANEELARHIGIRAVPMAAGVLIASGALAGLAGSSLILSSQTGTMQDGFSANYGYDGIAVALLAHNSPRGALLSALLLASMRQSAGLIQAYAGVPSGLVDLAQGIVIVFVVASVLLLRPRSKARATAPAATPAGKGN